MELVCLKQAEYKIMLKSYLHHRTWLDDSIYGIQLELDKTVTI